jgi:hypothetical protein
LRLQLWDVASFWQRRLHFPFEPNSLSANVEDMRHEAFPRDAERRWLSLARSYQFAEQVETFTNHNKKRLDDAAKVVDLRTQGHGD